MKAPGQSAQQTAPSATGDTVAFDVNSARPTSALFRYWTALHDQGLGMSLRGTMHLRLWISPKWNLKIALDYRHISIQGRAR